jgi:hypothetical protein
LQRLHDIAGQVHLPAQAQRRFVPLYMVRVSGTTGRLCIQLHLMNDKPLPAKRCSRGCQTEHSHSREPISLNGLVPADDDPVAPMLQRFDVSHDQTAADDRGQKMRDPVTENSLVRARGHRYGTVSEGAWPHMAARGRNRLQGESSAS